MAEEKQYTFEELKNFYSSDKLTLIDLYKNQFKKCVDSYCNQDGLFYFNNNIRYKIEKEISKKFHIKQSKVCLFAHCFNENIDLLNGNIKADSEDDLYFIESENYLKIGRTNDIKIRLSSLQTNNPDKLTVIYVKHGAGNQEFAIHRLFKYLRIKGEWFKKHEDIYNYILLLSSFENTPREINWNRGKIKHELNHLMNDL